MFWLNKAFAGNTFAPVQGTEVAAKWDALYSFSLWCSLISSVLVICGMIYFAFKYRRKGDNDKTAYIAHNGTLEFLWSFIPFVFFMIFFGWGWYVYHQLRTAPDSAMEIHVQAQKWSWDFIYKDGRTETNALYVPVNTPVKLIMTSKDVLHSFFVPAFRTKQDVVPGMYTTVWFEATKEGEFQVFCTEFCGAKHSAMLAKVHVLSEEKFDQWVSVNPYEGLSLSEIGEKVFSARCTACHSTGANKVVGPGMKGLFGRTSSLASGGSVNVDENYIRESILQPNAKVVAGYAKGIMPSFAGQVKDKEIAGIIEYLKTLK